MERSVSGVGVLDKSIHLLDVLEERPRSLAELVAVTGLSRATAHRLAVALEAHGLVRRDEDGRFALGVRLVALGRAAAESIPLATAAGPALTELRDATGESVQLYVRQGDRRVCIAALESPHGLRTIVPMGASLPLGQGSAGTLLARAGDGAGGRAGDGAGGRAGDGAGGRAGDGAGGRAGDGAGGRNRSDAATAGSRDPEWVQSVGQREAGVASVSAPVLGPEGQVVAAVSVSGPIERTTRHPGRRYADAVVAAARRIERAAGLRA